MPSKKSIRKEEAKRVKASTELMREQDAKRVEEVLRQMEERRFEASVIVLTPMAPVEYIKVPTGTVVIPRFTSGVRPVTQAEVDRAAYMYQMLYFNPFALPPYQCVPKPDRQLRATDEKVSVHVIKYLAKNQTKHIPITESAFYVKDYYNPEHVAEFLLERDQFRQMLAMIYTVVPMTPMDLAMHFSLRRHMGNFGPQAN